MLTRQDYSIAALIGFLVGVFAVPIAINLEVRQRLLLMLLPLIVPPIFILGMWMGSKLSRIFPVMTQFSKFAAVGFLNAAIDFGVLNILSLATGVTEGIIVGGVNIPGFALAATNGYFWNKFWVFSARGGSATGGQERNDVNMFQDFPKFMGVSIVGAIINSGVVILITSYTPLGLQEGSLLNLAKAAASASALFWNFLGYKFLVFRKAT